MKNITGKFIHQTAKDYDMSFADVRKIADISRDTDDFYSRLESFIKERKNK